MAGEVDELEAVLQLLRKYGFSKCESALMEDILDKSQLNSSDFQKFLFPIAPPLAPVKVPATRRQTTETDDGGGNCSCKGSLSSDYDEFVSLGSSTTELCSSDFTNPYGVQKTRPTSRASSDSLSQFGTARVEFDMQNDLFWYREKDDDFDKPSHFDGQGLDGEPSEDKYIMTVQTEKDLVEHDFLSGERKNYLENGRSNGNSKDAQYHKYYGLDNNFREEKTEKLYEQRCKDYSCSDPLCACCKDYIGNFGAENYKVRDVHDHHTESENEVTNNRNSGDDLVGIFDNIRGFDTIKEDRNYDFLYDGNIFGGPHEPNSVVDEGGGASSDEVDIYDNQEDDYEIFNLRIIHRKNRTGFEENKEFPIVVNSMIAGRYYITEYLGSAAFSRVVQAHDLYSGMDVCLKIIKNDKDFFDQSLDEIKLLKFVNKHDPTDQHHILRLYDYFYHQEHLFIVTELLRANLYEFQKYSQESGGEPYFTMHRLQAITRQCLEALLYLHDLGIIHCDLKPENILIKSYRRCEIKVIDLGSSCFKTDNLSLYVQSRSYRAPEVMLGLPYDHKIDLWSVGCILAELYSGEVLFPNEAVPLLLARMIGTLGPIDTDMLRKGQNTHKYFTKEYDLFHINEDTNQLEYIIPEETSLEHHLRISDPVFLHFLRYVLQINPKRRPNAREALEHPWLSQLYESNSC